MTLFEQWATFWATLVNSIMPIFMGLLLVGLGTVIIAIPYLILKELLVYGRKVSIQIIVLATVFELAYISVFLWLLSGLIGI